MELLIENLGAITQAKIDLSKKLIIFCGMNGTGKTYLSYVLYSFLTDDSPFAIHILEKAISEVQNGGFFKLNIKYIEDWLAFNCKNIKANLGSIFGISDETVSKLFPNFSIQAYFSKDEYEDVISSSFDIMFDDGRDKWMISKDSGSEEISIKPDSAKQTLLKDVSFFLYYPIQHIIRRLAIGNRADARMLTVERNSIYTFKTELSLSRNELIDRLQQNSKSDFIDILNNSSRRYPQAIRSSLRIANDLETVQKQTSEFANFAIMIEKDLLNGEVNMTKNGDVEFHAKGMAKSRRLPFHMSSSIVKTMASLVIYLRHIAKNGDTLIIDEPEMNFHPNVQVLLSKIFAMLSSSGINVILSTHSDYVIREFNNIIMASSLSRNNIEQQIIDELGYRNSAKFDYKDLLVMYFYRKSTKTINVSSIPVNEYGFSVASIDETIAGQNQIAERLYDILSYID